jgi:hypothetical protein
MVRIVPDRARRIAAPAIVEFALDALDVPRVADGGSAEPVAEDDRVWDEVTGATVEHDQQILIDPPSPDGPVRYESSADAVATVDEHGLMTHVTDGSARCYVTVGATRRNTPPIEFAAEGGGTVRYLRNFQPGSWMRWVLDALDGGIEGKVATAATKALFTAADHAMKTYTRNSGCWAAGIDLTCASVWTSTGSQAVTAFTPRDILAARHLDDSTAPGTVVRFAGPDGEWVERTVIARVRHPDYNASSLAHDITVATLDADLPAWLSPALLAPPDWRDWTRAGDGHARRWENAAMPIGYCDQAGQALYGWCDFEELFLHGSPWGRVHAAGWDRHSASEMDGAGARATWWEEAVGGDSSRPMWQPHPDGTVLVGLLSAAIGIWLTSGFSNSGEIQCTSLTLEHGFLTSALTTLGSPHELAVADLSGFTNFAE